MIINNFNIKGIIPIPHETDAIPAIDPDAVLPFPVTQQRFQPVSGWRPEIIQACRRVEPKQLSPCRLQHVGRQASCRYPLKKPLRLFASE